HAYRFERYKPTEDSRRVGRLLLSAHHDVSEPVRVATIVAEAQNRTRDLGNTPGNDLPPSALAAYAEALAGRHGLSFPALEAIGALAELRAPVRVLGLIGATENLPSDTAIKPGDIVRSLDGTTVEINNTDAEGRLVLADCIAHARREGAERLVDLATLTGGVV